MRQVLRNMFLCGCLTAVANAQEMVTVKAPPHDLSRPVSSVIDQIRKQTGASITYEDPRYVNQSDIEDVTDAVSKASDPEKNHGSRILIPKGHPLTFVYAPSDMKSPNSAKAVLERLVREYALGGGPVFDVTQDGPRLHVVPNQVLDASGALVHQSSILETVITVPPRIAKAENCSSQSATRFGARQEMSLQSARARPATIYPASRQTTESPTYPPQMQSRTFLMRHRPKPPSIGICTTIPPTDRTC